ncbi:cyclic nucleotide gated channel protein [Medicago truncatula]|uniref:Cyclic nucleotide gated channel protein n=1 Tax=Medicago truncatula TaxID=3880 RepID=A0A072UCP0_MEDTR|nr:cyclic nucleotide gated channel protein [Medicago truncatula]
MNDFEKDEITILSEKRPQPSEQHQDSNFQRNISRTQSASVFIPMASLDPYERQPNLVRHTARNSPISQMSGPLYATPATGNIVVAGNKFHNFLYGDANCFGRKLLSFCSSCIPRVMNPHCKVVQQWNTIFAISCSVAIFFDPLFFFLYYVNKDDKCIVINWTMATLLSLLRSIMDVLYFLNILLQFRLAYINPEYKGIGAADLVDHPTRIAHNYLKGYFFIDLFVASPLPQIMILLSLGSLVAHNTKNLLPLVISLQYIPKLYRYCSLLIGQSPTPFIFASGGAYLTIGLLTFMFFGHVVGSCWYLFGLQRVNQCLRDACHHSNLLGCMDLIDCDSKVGNISATLWSEDKSADACLNATSGAFSYGIYGNAIPLTIETKVINKYVYALFWGFQQIITLAGNQTPSYFVWEVLFTVSIMALGLILLALLIGNIQGFFQTLGKRSLEWLSRGSDVEQWMSRRHLPENLKRRVRQAERYSWAATRGVSEKMILENLPEDLQIDIRRHIFKFVKKVPIFSLMDENEPILDAILERLIHTMYNRGSRILSQGCLIQKVVFIVRGKLESIGEDGIPVTLTEGDACGEELLRWYLERSSKSKEGKKVKLQGWGLTSTRSVKCLTNVEAFSLRVKDIEELATLFAGFLRSPHTQGVIRSLIYSFHFIVLFLVIFSMSSPFYD